MNIQRANERGHFENEWLNTRFSFSFAEYHNPERMGFGALRVLNDDIIGGHNGFGSHPHRDMEIITIPFEGKITHKDSTGSEGTIGAGEIQVMSAGSGIIHSEFNNHDEDVKLFQIWIHTREKGIAPRHETKKISLTENELTKIVSGDQNEDTLTIHQDAIISLGKCNEKRTFEYTPQQGNGIFVMVIEGSIKVNGEELLRRDSAELVGENLTIGASNAYFMVIEVPM